ncbi:MAG: transposase [Bdellovibrionaceae bacterium]|nr:transposase [Pseudobdellovibrionaceae bacterium]
MWTPAWSQKEEARLVFPIVIKRTWSDKLEKKKKKLEEQKGLFMDGFMEEEPWEYYAVVSNIPLNTDKLHNELQGQQRYWSIQQIFEFHQKRGNAENFIREEKYNFRLKNYPCQKLMANHAYGLIAQIAHNLLRWVAILLQPDKPHYSKKLRNNLILIPGHIIKTSAYTLMKIPKWAYKEVQALREACRFKPETVPAYYSTA